MKKFTIDYLVNELGLPYNYDYVIEDTMIDKGRWSITHRLIFKDNDDKVYRAYYDEPVIEEQKIQPWEHDNEVKCEEVFPMKVKTTIWVAPGELNCAG